MTKQENIDNPNSCWNKARSDELVFILREKDKTMGKTIRFWAAERVKDGLNKSTDAKIVQALELAYMLDGFDGTYPPDPNQQTTAGQHQQGSGV